MAAYIVLNRSDSHSQVVDSFFLDDPFTFVIVTLNIPAAAIPSFSFFFLPSFPPCRFKDVVHQLLITNLSHHASYFMLCLCDVPNRGCCDGRMPRKRNPVAR